MIRLTLLFLATISANNWILCRGADIYLSFSNFSSSRKDHVDVEIVLPPNSSTKLLVIDIPLDIGFLIVQTHSYLHEIILSFDPSIMPENHANGTNVGLFYRNHGPGIFYLMNHNNFNVTVMTAAVPYTIESPIPGGCNMAAPLSIKPFLNLELNSAMVYVDGAPAMVYADSSATNMNGYDHCDINPFAYVMFYKYIPERDFSVETYFDAIRSMLTYPRILNGSYVAPEPTEGPPLRRIFSKYSGTGSVYSLIAFNKYGNVAVYTPTFTYGCDDVLGDTPCELIGTPIMKLQFAMLMSLSAFICFAGHRYFLGELFFMGALAGGLVSHILLLLQTDISDDLLLMNAGISIVSGAIWVCIWWLISSPIVSVALPFMVNGFLLSATVFFYYMYSFSILQNDLNFWFSFFILMLVIFLLSTTNPVKCNMLACGVVGAFGIILPLDYYIGSNLKYILINMIRRATVEGFNLASTRPPLQLADGVLCTMWLICAFGGYRCQKIISANRSPFPPVCLALREPIPENVPILTNARFPTYT